MRSFLCVTFLCGCSVIVDGFAVGDAAVDAPDAGVVDSAVDAMLDAEIPDGGCECEPRPHSTPSCVEDVCGLDCDEGWQNCDEDLGNGCERPGETCLDETIDLRVGEGVGCLLRESGLLYCWGMNTLGEVGDGTNTPRSEPTLTAEGRRFSSIAVGRGWVCGLDATTTRPWCWGRGELLGQPGASDPSNTPAEVQFDGLPGNSFTHLAGTLMVACVIDENADAWCWGDNTQGQLGTGAIGGGRDRAVRVAIDGTVVDIQPGGQHTCALVASAPDEDVYCWGSNQRGEVGVGDEEEHLLPMQIGIQADVIGTAQFLSCASGAGGNVCWGESNRGGLCSMTPRSTSPLEITDSASNVAVGTQATFHLSEGRWRGCGDQEEARLPTGTIGSNLSELSILGFLPPEVDLRVGHRGGCYLSGTAPPACWGTAVFGELANRPLIVSDAEVASDSSRVVAGAAFACRIAEENVECWGDNGAGQLARAGDVAQPTPVAAPVGIEVWAGGRTACVAESGATSCWGSNDSGQIPTFVGTETRSAIGLGKRYEQLSIGRAHICGSTETDLECWGDNADGQLTGSGNAPRVIAPATTVFDAGGHHTCALVEGTLQCVGRNTRGQLGDGDTGSRNDLAAVDLADDIVQVALGGEHSCVRTSEGRAFCWGRNSEGQVTGTAGDDRLTPVLVPLMETIRDIAAGARHTCAIFEAGDGTDMRCWGDNTRGQTSRAPPYEPRPGFIGSAPGAVELAISPDADFTLVRLADGQVRCSGADVAGVCSTNELYSATPIDVVVGGAP